MEVTGGEEQTPTVFTRSMDEGEKAVKFTRPGVIVFTEHYEACVAFYRDVLQLEIMHRIDRDGERLTTFAYGGAYLMIETGGVASEQAKSMAQNPTKLRFNVPDVKLAAAELAERGVHVEVLEHSWGDTAEFLDPDGNRCALRSDRGFGE